MENKIQEEFEWGEYKRCAKCKENKPLSDFYYETMRSAERKVDIWKSYCHLCAKINLKRHRDDRHRFVHDYKQKHPCIECGEKDPIVLEFDHRDRETKCFTVAAGVARTIPLETIKEEMAKCDVLCANCHRRKTAKQLGYYSYRILHENEAEMVE